VSWHHRLQISFSDYIVTQLKASAEADSNAPENLPAVVSDSSTEHQPFA